MNVKENKESIAGDFNLSAHKAGRLIPEAISIAGGFSHPLLTFLEVTTSSVHKSKPSYFLF
jgi:hypothetical protein